MQVIVTKTEEGNSPEHPSRMGFIEVNLQLVPENTYERVFLYEIRDNPRKLTFSLPPVFSEDALWECKGKKK